MEGTIISLLPSVITIALIIFTRRIFLSLGTGIVLGAILIEQWNVFASVVTILEIMKGVFLGDSKILIFVLLIGMMTSLIYLSGGILAFSEWAINKVKTKFQAKMVTLLLGFIIFFDDACSCLLRGNVVRPITDNHRISRSKLSYLIHSTAAPIILIIPLSGMAAAVAAIMGGLLSDNGITNYGAFEAFVLTIPSNYYAITCLLMAFMVAYFGINLGQMRRDEKRAVEEGVLFDTSRGVVPGQSDNKLPARKDGKVIDLMLPVITLVVATIVIALWIGFRNIEGQITGSGILSNMDITTGLVYGSLLACVVSLIKLFMKRTSSKDITIAIFSGLKTTLPSVLILFLALITAEIIGELGVGTYLATFFSDSTSISWFSVIFFVLAAIMSFSTGSTFGTLILMLPIGAEIIAIIDPTFVIPVFGAVLAGCIFGEHSSPLSDTSILSSIGSGVHAIDHIMSQLPYALICGVVSIFGYMILGLTNSVVIGLLSTVLMLALVVLLLKNKFSTSNTYEFDA
jgi:tetracycline resistance efflux pump